MEQFAYVSFDRIPSPKGAAVHIKEFVRALGREFGAVDLVTPSSEAREVELITSRGPGGDHYQLPAVGGDLIRRVMSFRSALSR